MSDRRAKQHIRGVVKQSTAGLFLVFLFSVALVPRAAFAEETTQPANEPAYTLPVTCTDAARSPETAEGEQASSSAWTPLEVTSVARTNNATLTWTWTKATSESVLKSYDTYGYALYNGSSFMKSGELAADATSYTYEASSDGVYRVYVWINENKLIGEPEPTHCDFSDTERDATGPIIQNDGFTLNDNKATPNLSTTETDTITYSWEVNASSDEVTISDRAVLVPTFTFLFSGTYTFTLTATDSLGNVSVLSMQMTFSVPSVPPTTEPPLELPESTDPLETYTPPEEAKAAVNRNTLNSYNFGAAAYDLTQTIPDDGTTQGGSADTKGASTFVATGTVPIEPSAEGWRILGISWYWWILASVIIGIGWLWLRGIATRGKSPDDV